MPITSGFLEDVNSRQRLSFFFFLKFETVLENSTPKNLPKFDEQNEMELARYNLKQREFTFQVQASYYFTHTVNWFFTVTFFELRSVGSEKLIFLRGQTEKSMKSLARSLYQRVING